MLSVDTLIDWLDWMDDTTGDTTISALAIMLVLGYLLIELVFLLDRIRQNREGKS